MATATRPGRKAKVTGAEPQAKRARRNKPEQTVYTVVVTREADGRYCANAPALDGCGSFGGSLPEALQMAEEAIRLYINCRRELGWPVPADDPHVEIDMSESREALVYRLTIREQVPGA